MEGSSAVNEAALTGESIPVDKAAGDAGVCSYDKPVRDLSDVSATRVGEDTTLSQIIKMVSDAAATKGIRLPRSQIRCLVFLCRQ